MIKLPSFVDNYLDNLIIVTGLVRSGTTLLGKILGTLKNVEYGMEPPLISYLNALIRDKQIEASKALDVTIYYLFTDYLVNCIHGRNYNMRASDDSCIFNIKTYKEVTARWNKISNTKDAMDYLKEYNVKLIIKNPMVYDLLPHMVTKFKGIKIIDTNRNLKRVLSSIMAKKWLSEGNLGPNYSAAQPLHDCNTRLMVPYWVEKDKIEFWNKANFITRNTYFCNVIAKNKLTFHKFILECAPHSCLEVKYEDLVENPRETSKKVFDFLALKEGSLTSTCIGEIKATKTAHDIDSELDKCDNEVKEEFYALNRLLGYEV